MISISKGAFRPLSLALLAVALLALTGCAGTNLGNLKEYYFGDLFSKKSSSIDKTAEQLALSGMAQLEKKNMTRRRTTSKSSKSTIHTANTRSWPT